MKKYALIALTLILCSTQLMAQRNAVNFFEPNGVITNSPLMTSDLSYSLTHLDHRADDVVWARVVYSIIDLRDIRNVQLAFPTGQDVVYRNLFRLISDGVVNKIPVYYPNEAGVSPYFDATNIIPLNKLSDVFFIETNVGGAQYIDPLFELDSVRNTLNLSNRIYNRFSSGVKKFMLQKVYYFDKHLSTIGSKIIGIAPMRSDTESQFGSFDVDFGDEEVTEPGTTALKSALSDAILCWFLYDDLKAHFSSQPIYPGSNAAQRVSYHEFFTKKMFADYLVGDNNLMKRLYGNTEEITLSQLKKEISQVENELIEVESDIWAR